jgi:hypothetical protein
VDHDETSLRDMAKKNRTHGWQHSALDAMEPTGSDVPDVERGRYASGGA